ncbi:biotin-dependent carboxyltransferase family protein [uncultured Cedecea sp.]|uniref:5-oxoprolinase subunit C family protein n=1 Tax=uncultured Cedecea sp. TaxID=988762 RepID=UPI00261AFBB3|nr:biotin-dependent carboxyltransferase family protein [uncultured Cedecea sp.]
MTFFDVISPGLMSTLQDAGRLGYEDRGVPPSGVMDTLSFSLANALVANTPGTGVIEFTLTGPTLRLGGDQTRCIAVTGDAEVMLNATPLPVYQSHLMQPGDLLTIKRLRSGARGYFAVAGGFDVQPQLGSVSTLTRARLGGFHGRIMQKNDRLPLCNIQCDGVAGIRADCLFPQREKRPFRVVWGPQDTYFDDAARHQFQSQCYHLSPQCDRMGYRLQGEPLEHLRGFNIISDAISHGSIQIPGDGLPIIAMNDRQTTGGYPKIATVIRADLARLGQLKPGDSIQFEAVSVEKAESIWRGRQAILQEKLAELSRRR